MSRAVFYALRNPRFLRNRQLVQEIVGCCRWVCMGGETAKNDFLGILPGICRKNTGLEAVTSWNFTRKPGIEKAVRQFPETNANKDTANLYLPICLPLT